MSVQRAIRPRNSNAANTSILFNQSSPADSDSKINKSDVSNKFQEM
jgi:hypothetical protein